MFSLFPTRKKWGFQFQTIRVACQKILQFSFYCRLLNGFRQSNNHSHELILLYRIYIPVEAILAFSKWVFKNIRCQFLTHFWTVFLKKNYHCAVWVRWEHLSGIAGIDYRWRRFGPIHCHYRPILQSYNRHKDY